MLYQSQHFGISEYFCKEFGENLNFKKHLHHSFELITLLEGKMTVTVGNTRYELEAGESIFVFPEQIHSFESTSSRHFLVIFSPDIVRAYYTRHSSEFPVNNKLLLPPKLVSQIAELEQESSVIKMKAALYSVCAALDESTAYHKRKNGETGLLSSIFSFVEQHFDKSCTLENLSSALGYNPSYLSRYFSESTNVSFISFVNRYRIGRACYLLSNTDRSVLDCSCECGYVSLRSFNRNFKIYTGTTPREYRENGRHII